MKQLFTLFLVLCVFGMISAESIRIHYTNDTHAAYQPARNGLGGYPALEYHLQKSRSESLNSIYLDAGDQQTGSIFSSMEYQGLKGGAVLETFGRLGLEAATLGNHEFDVSNAHATALVKTAPYPFLSANILNQDGSSFGRDKYQIFNKGALKVGVIGLTIFELPERVKAENVADLTILPYKDAIDAVIDEVDKASDLIILLTHNGWEADSLLATTLDSRVDIIIGGHSHIATEQAAKVNGIYILSSGSHLQLLGIADLEVENDAIASIQNKLQPLSQAPEGYKTELTEFLKGSIGALEISLAKKIGKVPFAFSTDKFQITQSSLWTAKALLKEYPSAEIAFINNGGLRKNIPAGDVTLRDMHELIPFGNTVVLCSALGKDIMAADKKNRQLAIDKPYDILSSSWDNWMVDITPYGAIASQPLDPDKMYRIVTHDYIISQWDKYLGFQLKDIDETGDLFLDAIIRQVEKQYGL